MRTTAAGFILGYLVVGIVLAPSLLWAMRVTPSYLSGVAMVLDRSGVSGTAAQTAHQLLELRNRVMLELAADLDRLIFQRPPN